MADHTQPGGLFASLKALLATLIAIGHNRLELFSTELQEEIPATLRSRYGRWPLSCWHFWQSFSASEPSSLRYRKGGAPGCRVIALFVCVPAAVAALISHNRATAKPRLFDATLTQLGKDRDQLSQ